VKQPEEILKKNPGSLIFARYAQQLAMEGNISEAILILEKGIKSNPSYAIGHSVLAKILHSQNSPEGAAEEWTAALKLDPQLPSDLFLYGKNLLKNENHSEACKYLFAASRYEPDNTDILMALDQAMTGTDESNDLDLAEETTEALAEMYEMDVEEEIIAHLESDDSHDTGGTAIVEALDQAQKESFFDEDEDEDVEDKTLSERVTESDEADETVVIMTQEDDSSQDIGDTMISGVNKPIEIEEEVTEGDDFDALLKSFVDYDEENEVETVTEAEDGSVTETPEFEEAEDTVIPVPVDEDVEPAEKDSDDTLISGVYEVIQEEEKKAASDDYKSLLESFSGDEPEGETLEKILEESESESVDNSILDTITPQTTVTEEHEASDEIPEQDVMDETVESAEIPQADFLGEEIVESHEDEVVETALEEEPELPDEPISDEEADSKSQPDELSEDTVIVEPVGKDASEDSVFADSDVTDAGVVAEEEPVVTEEELQEDTEETTAGNIADEFPFDEYQNDVNKLMGYIDEDSEAAGEDEPVEAVEETVPETTDDVLPEDLPEFGGIEIEEDIAGMGTDDIVPDDTTILQIDEENVYDPAQFEAEPTSEEDDEPVLSSHERAELLGLKEEQPETAEEIPEMTEIIQESVEQEVDELPADLSQEQAVDKSAMDETISPIEDLYSQLSKEEEISEEPEPAADVSEAIPEEEMREGIDYSDVLANIDTAYEEKTMDVEEVFDNEPVIQDDTESESVESSTFEIADSVLDIELPDTGNNDIDISRETLEDLLDEYIETLKEPVDESGPDDVTPEEYDKLPEKAEERKPASDDTTVSDVTATMAEIFVSQGLRSRAIDIYRTLLVKDPDNDHIRNRIDELNTLPDQFSETL